MRFTKKESREVAKGFVEMRQAVVMASNRLDAALLDDPPCKHCVEVAQSYLLEVLGRSPQEGGDATNG